MSGKGLRKNDGKPHVELCPGIVNELVGTVLWESAAPRGKYEMHNWRKGLKWLEEVLGSLERHLNALKEGEDIDPESGLPHIAHLLTNAMFYAYYERHGLGEDDRPKCKEAPGAAECRAREKEWCKNCGVYFCDSRRDGRKIACKDWEPISEVRTTLHFACDKCSHLPDNEERCPYYDLWENGTCGGFLRKEQNNEVEAIGGKNCGE
jgi:hypothetical protein